MVHLVIFIKRKAKYEFRIGSHSTLNKLQWGMFLS